MCSMIKAYEIWWQRFMQPGNVIKKLSASNGCLYKISKKKETPAHIQPDNNLADMPVSLSILRYWPAV